MTDDELLQTINARLNQNDHFKAVAERLDKLLQQARRELRDRLTAPEQTVESLDGRILDLEGTVKRHYQSHAFLNDWVDKIQHKVDVLEGQVKPAQDHARLRSAKHWLVRILKWQVGTELGSNGEREEAKRLAGLAIADLNCYMTGGP